MSDVVSGMLTLDGWWGMEWQEKVKNPKWRYGMNKVQKKARKGSLIAKMKQNQYCECLDN